MRTEQDNRCVMCGGVIGSNWPDGSSILLYCCWGMASGGGSNPSRTFQRNAISGKIIYVTPFYWYPEKFQWRNTCTAKQEGQVRFLLLEFRKGWKEKRNAELQS